MSLVDPSDSTVTTSAAAPYTGFAVQGSPEAPLPPGIRADLVRLSRAINRLVSADDMQAAQIESILLTATESGDCKKSEGVPEPNRSDIAQEIHSQTLRIEQLASRVEDRTRRVNL